MFSLKQLAAFLRAEPRLELINISHVSFSVCSENLRLIGVEF